MAERLDLVAREAEGEVAACRRAGDLVGMRAARERARGAARAAELLRAGPSGVAGLLAS